MLESANCLRMGPFIDLPASRSGRGNAALSSRRTAPRRSPAAHPPLMDPVGVPGIGNGWYASPQSKGKICRGVPFWRRGSCAPRTALAAIGARITPAPVQPWQPLCPHASCLLSPMSKRACASGTWPAMQAHWGRSPLSRCKGFLGAVSKGQAAGSANQATLVVRSRVRCCGKSI